jgi:hypothetical protein
MKKGLILGAAALAAVTVAVSSADASEVKFGGYYRVQGTTGDLNVADNDKFVGGAKADSNSTQYRHRLNIVMKMIASEKTHATLEFRPVSDTTIEGGSLGDGSAANSLNANAGAGWTIQRLWLETEAAGIGIKVGEMPLNLHHSMLYDDDGGSVGALILSKTFGGVTVLAADVHASETGTAGTVTGAGSNEDDADIYALAALGKAGSINYGVTLAYLDAGRSNPIAAPSVTSTQVGETAATGMRSETDNWWLAATIAAEMGGIKFDITGIHEAGYDKFDQATTKSALTEQLSDSGYMFGAHMSGSAGFGGWKAFGWYADENYSSMINKPNWNHLHNGNVSDLMTNAMINSQTGSASAANSLGATTSMAIGELENTHGIGAELSIKAGNFTIKPGIEYMAVTEDQITVNGTKYQADVDSAWGGYVIVSTQIDTGTTLSLAGAYVDPDANKTEALMPNSVGIDSIHEITAEIKMAF